VTVILHRDVSHLLLGRPVLRHVGRGREREDAGEREASVCSQRASDAYAKYSVESAVGTFSTRSAPPTMMMSETPAAISIVA